MFHLLLLPFSFFLFWRCYEDSKRNTQPDSKHVRRPSDGGSGGTSTTMPTEFSSLSEHLNPSITHIHIHPLLFFLFQFFNELKLVHQRREKRHQLCLSGFHFSPFLSLVFFLLVFFLDFFLGLFLDLFLLVFFLLGLFLDFFLLVFFLLDLFLDLFFIVIIIFIT